VGCTLLDGQSVRTNFLKRTLALTQMEILNGARPQSLFCECTLTSLRERAVGGGGGWISTIRLKRESL